ncbi:MAG TPA: adenylate/guanylate cyclase domain-containing protein [Thermoleophilaceae bacterium]
MSAHELSARVGETRRLTMMFCDVVGSTELSTRHEPEAYRELMGAYRAACRDVIESRFEGHIVQLKGDGAMSSFGFPVAHENDAERAVLAGLALVRAVRELSAVTKSTVGESLEVRVGVHHGPVYVDLDEDDVYGLAANVAARLQTIAEPDTVVVSDEVRRLVEHRFEIEPGASRKVQGVAEPLQPFRVIRERAVPLRRTWSTPLIERQAELELLLHAWTRTTAGDAGRSTGVLVHGEAGVGKSRLVAEFVDAARAPRVLELHGSPFHRDVGFHPVRKLIEVRCGLSDDAGGAQRLECLTRELTSLGLDPSEVNPLLAPVLDIEPTAGYEQAATEGRLLKEQVAEAVLRYLAASTGGEAAIIVAENVHWFDESSRELLSDLLRRGPESMLILSTSRERLPGSWEPIELRPLTQDGCLALIDALESRLSEQERLTLTGRSGGIPLYLEELVRAGAVETSTRTRETVPVAGSVPEVLYEPLVARLYATPAALPVAAAAAAAGQDVDRSLLAATMSIPADELDSPLQALVDAGILESVEGRATHYRFRHDLLREVAYELQPPSWRRKVHHRLCDVLARDEPSDWHLLASHLERAERNREAADAYQQTAELARRRGALSEARGHLTRAIELAALLADDTTRDHREVELRLRRGFLAMSAEGAGSPDASADFGRCLELAAADPRGDDMFSTLIALWAYHLSRAELDRAREVSVTLRAALGTERSFFAPQNLAGFGMLDWFGGSFTSALDTLAAAIAQLPDVGQEDAVAAVWFVPNDPTVAMYAHLGLAHYMSGSLAEAEESFVRAQAVAASLDFPQGPWSSAYAHWLSSFVWIEADRLDMAEQALRDITTASERHGLDSWALIAATQTAALEAIRVLKSGTADATALSAHADAVSAHVEIWQVLELRVFLPFYLTTIGALLAASGDAQGAEKRYAESLELAAETGMRFYDSETMRRSAHLASSQEELLASLQAALDLARSQGARPFELRIALDLEDAQARLPTTG